MAIGYKLLQNNDDLLELEWSEPEPGDEPTLSVVVHLQSLLVDDGKAYISLGLEELKSFQKILELLKADKPEYMT